MEAAAVVYLPERQLDRHVYLDITIVSVGHLKVYPGAVVQVRYRQRSRWLGRDVEVVVDKVEELALSRETPVLDGGGALYYRREDAARGGRIAFNASVCARGRGEGVAQRGGIGVQGGGIRVRPTRNGSEVGACPWLAQPVSSSPIRINAK